MKNKIPYHAYIDPELNKMVLRYLDDWKTITGKKLTRSDLMVRALEFYLHEVEYELAKEE